MSADLERATADVIEEVFRRTGAGVEDLAAISAKLTRLVAAVRKEAEEAEQVRTQTAVLECLERLVGKEHVRGGDGCDSSDPLDWTIAAISLTVTAWLDRRAEEG